MCLWFWFVLVLIYNVLCGTLLFFFFFKQKTAYEMRISDWSSDVCSSDLGLRCRSAPARTAFEIRSRVDAGVRTVGRPAADHRQLRRPYRRDPAADRESVVEGKSVSVRVDLGGLRSIKKKKRPNATDKLIIMKTTSTISTK